jgi:uncharacterized protein (DUF2252 family)
MASRSRSPYPSVDQRRVRGQEARNRTPLSRHGRWAAVAERPDPVGLLQEQNRTREPDLVPVRHGRMLVSPFTFYRGAAKIMAADLAGTPTAGLHVQLCGDAHLSNFGAFASPERRLLFDVNDFDETLPGPFEYDVKRLATSFTIAGRNNGFSKGDARAAALEAAKAYREAMAGFAAMGTMEVWYARLDEDQLLQAMRRATAQAPKKQAKAARREEKTLRKEATKARTRDSLQALSKLGELVEGHYRIVSQPPIVIPARDLEASFGLSRDQIEDELREQFRAYRASLGDDRRQLLERFEILDMARKVVGVGSVGTLAYIVLLQGRDQHDPLFLQVKEATRSVLEGPLPRSRYRQHGERVVYGQRMMQADSDIYLGWSRGMVDVTRHFYWRQLRDMKASADVEAMTSVALTFYARTCGWTLARVHARSGDPIAIATYLGKRDQFDRSITDFSERYADQNEQDYQAFANAIQSGHLQALEGV